MHVVFISTEKEYSKNQELLGSGKLLKWNNNIYKHITTNEKSSTANLYIIFSSAFDELFDSNKKKFYKHNNNYYYKIKDWKEFDIETPETIKTNLDIYKHELNNFFKLFTLSKVTDRFIYYKDINFKTQKYRNTYEAKYKYVEDPNGEYKSFDGLNLKRIDKNATTLKQTYDGDLRRNELFHIENYPKLRYSKILHYFDFDIENAESLDVENTPVPINAITGYSNIYNKYFTWVLKEHKDQKIDKFSETKLFIFDDEIKMLRHFISTIIKLDLNILTGWNISGFDIPYIYNRCKKLKIDIDSIFNNFKIIKKKDGSKNYICDNIVFFDLRDYFIFVTKKNKPKSFHLDVVGEHVCGVSKIQHDGIINLWKYNINKFIEYSFRDVQLTEMINLKSKLLSSAMITQQAIPQNLENVFFVSKTIANFMRMKFKDLKFPTKRNVDKGEKFKGAYVIKTDPGLYQNCGVFDFNHLYPAIMITMNISPETIVTDKPFDPQTMVNIDGIFFDQTKMGIIPKTVKFFLDKREEVKKEKNKYDGNSIEYDILSSHESNWKLLSNSVYGGLGYHKWFLHDENCAKSVTCVARELLKHSKTLIESDGKKCLFGDTDSICFAI